MNNGDTQKKRGNEMSKYPI